MVVPVGGLLCYCGNRGCLETVASAQAQELVSQPIQTQLPRSAREITLDVIEQAFTHGDSNVHHAVMETGRYLGMAISNLVGTLNIQLIVLTGDMTIFGSPWLDAIREVFTVTTLSRLALETRIEIGQLGENNIILRASATLANNYSLLFKSQLVHS